MTLRGYEEANRKDHNSTNRTVIGDQRIDILTLTNVRYRARTWSQMGQSHVHEPLLQKAAVLVLISRQDEAEASTMSFFQT